MMLFNFLLLIAASSALRCRCTPKDACWPSAQEWASLNASLAFNLIALRPYGSVCHVPFYDAAACAALQAAPNSNSVYLAAQPNTLQYPNWNSWPARNETCYVNTPKDIPCGQGRISLYSAEVKETKHVQAAVKFAVKHNLRLAIRNTGHSYLGTSSAPESLQIFTHNLNNITVHDDFQPRGCAHSEGSAVTIGAGVMLQDMYAALRQHGLIAAGGLSPSVGAAGGYVQGGGHGPLGPLLGFAADNALEFTIVNAVGDITYANDFVNRDLFWALRGGGGGSFGVVIDVTFRTYRDMPAFVQFGGLQASNETQFWSAVTALHAAIPDINDAGASGYYSLQIPSTMPIAKTFSISFFFIFANFTQDRASDVSSIMVPLATQLKRIAGAGFVLPPANYSASVHTFLEYYQTVTPDQTGFTDRLGSRLVSRDLLRSQDGPAKLSSALARASTGSVSVLGHIVAGGKASQKVINAVNPAWRRAAAHIAVSWSWDAATATPAYQKDLTFNITHEYMPALRTLEPDMGAYVNEADADEPAWQQSFWGSSYRRLAEIKKRWDPQGLFVVRRGVGSEDWDDEAMCRV